MYHSWTEYALLLLLDPELVPIPFWPSAICTGASNEYGIHMKPGTSLSTQHWSVHMVYDLAAVCGAGNYHTTACSMPTYVLMSTLVLGVYCGMVHRDCIHELYVRQVHGRPLTYGAVVDAHSADLWQWARWAWFWPAPPLASLPHCYIRSAQLLFRYMHIQWWYTMLQSPLKGSWSIFTLKKTRDWLKFWQGFQPISSW